MRSIIGLTLLITGLSIGAYAYYPETVQQHVSLANVTKVIAPVASAERTGLEYRDGLNLDGRRGHLSAAKSGGSSATSALDPRASRTGASGTDLTGLGRNFSPGTRLSEPGSVGKVPALNGGRAAKITTAALPSTRGRNAGKAALRNDGLRGGRSGSGHVGSGRAGWTAVVTPAISSRSGGSGNRPLRSSVPADGSARYALIRDIQRELKRVGCYWGKIDGSWGGGSKRAISGFVKSVNSTLPTRNPDYFLLALVRAQPGQVCGVPRSGAIVANAGPNAGTTVSRSATGRDRRDPNATSGVQRPSRLVARPRPARKSTRTAASSSSSTVIPPEPVLANSRRRVAAVNPKPAAQRRARSGRAFANGRMAVGGPLPDGANANSTVSGGTAAGVVTTATPNRKTNAQVRTKRKVKRVTTARLTTAPAPRPRVRAPTVSSRTKAVKVRKKKKHRRVARTSAKPSKKKRKRSYRRRRRGGSPLRNLLTQGVH